MDISNLTSVYNQNPALQSQYTLQQYLDLFGGDSSTTPPPTNPVLPPPPQGIIGADINTYQGGGGGGGGIQTLDQTWTQPRATDTETIQEEWIQRPRTLTAAEQEWQKGPFYGPKTRVAAMSGQNAKFLPMDKGYWNRTKKYKTPRTYGDQVYAQSLIDAEKGIKSIPTQKNWWDKTKDFFSGLNQPKERGTLGTRLKNQPRIPLPASMASWSQSPFNPKSRNWNPDFEAQLNYLEGMDGTKLSGDWNKATKFDKYGKPIEFGIVEGQAMIGRDPQSGHLKYGPGTVLEGKNVISGFGSNNYETALENYISKMEGYKKKTAFQEAKIKRAKAELAAWKNKQDEKINQEIIKKKIKDDTSGNNQTGGGGGRAVDTSRGAVAGAQEDISNYQDFKEVPLADGGRVRRLRSYFDGGLVSLRRR